MIVIVGAVPAVWICLDLFEVSFSSWNLALFACISSFLDCTGVHLLFFFLLSLPTTKRLLPAR
jgi:hypothetical protein